MKTTLIQDVGGDLLVVTDAFCSIEIQVEQTDAVYMIECDGDHKIKITQVEDRAGKEVNKVIYNEQEKA
ncbi:hypothetical protein M0R04_16110 [Candidatus Dojkabacteria bacterium]|jgi:hypothetical protein|nr:hypothetical protein [Candidatus Dojkabacteria bacterium]